MSGGMRPATATILASLRRQLKGQGIRVSQLADALSVAEPTVWRWLRGEGLTLDRLDEICGIAGIDLRNLVEKTDDGLQQSFTLSQERVLAADRRLALVFFSILNGAQREEIAQSFGLSPELLDTHLKRLDRLGLIDLPSRGRIRAKTSRSVRWRRGGPLAVAFEKTVKPLFMSMDFGAADARYVSDMVALTETGRERILALFDALREDVHLIAEQEAVVQQDARHWSGVLMMVRPLDIGEVTQEWNDRANRRGPRSGVSS
ncbi:helix-turn-helix domain-containing protein [Sphingobium sp. HWE2-09]|uniref:helix-turn-helix domain-containing protein n=1 Tax=Sphingobium sp. HWE2-09 TaxID=3108390 RepID=UPI002DC6119F|nr:helix-turn-helix transcriptional regulator [Sphingobium sp. HWE2-09]